MDNYNFGNVDIEFNTNKIFLLMQILYRMDSLENKIYTNAKISYLASYMEDFKKVMDINKQGLKEFISFKENAESKNMWAEYGEYIESFSQIDMEELQMQNPSMAKTIEELLNTDLFAEIDRINNEYTHVMENKFKEHTEPYKQEAEKVVGKTETKKLFICHLLQNYFL